ncbi:uncharacterized protein LOC108035588 isoform X9 [Drosophila biarmipes]|uniref:uncharacterized protein LOC108035588 isoform X9 n=1 Tax=Drosophila biarmipes TaxID=125945 RepID=UPI001CDB0BEC|nr:uncharacterized protein LOC108035588 isoform X9 [Drosophila biarmipes]
MDHLDLAGYHDNSSPNCNRLGAFDQKDGVYLSSSQRMLEPILEETSEDEESSQGSRCGYQKHRSTLWSSMDSEAASVIRINVIKDLYAMPKRDIASPDPIHSPEENVQLRGLLNPESHISIESILVTETCVRSTSESQGQRSDSRIRRGYTFEDFYFENDSYHSLSRSSSLVQFESLERQFMLKEQHHSMNSLGNSSPSLTYEIGASSRTIDSNPESNKGSASSLSLIKRFESSDCSYLHQTYYELNKLKFETQQSRDFLSNDLHKKEQKPNSETSSSSSSSSNRSSPSCSSCMASVGARTTESVTGVQDITAARRIPPNMTDKISEDSGYCERRTHHKKSKSIPKNFDKFFKDETLLKLKEAPPHSRNFNGEYDFYQPKIEQAMNTVTHTVKHTTICSSSTSINSSPEGAGYQSDSAWSLSSTSSSTMFTWLHNSLPDIRESQGLLAVGIIKRESKNAASIKNSISRSPSSIDGCDGKRQLEQISRSSSFKDPARSKVGEASLQYFNASYQNLSLLDYKDKRPARERLNHNYKKRQAEDMSDRNSVDEPYCEQPDQLICRENFLLDEISKIYDKNVCILTDKRALDYRFSSPGYCDSNTSDIMLKVHHVQLNPPPLQKRSAQNLSFNKNVTKFNEDQTNLRSTYAQSLDQCHFDMQWEAKAGRYQIKMQKSDAKKNSLVSSTPNLSAFDSRQEAEVEIYVSNTHTSMQHLSQKPTQSNPLSILLSVGSRHSLEKEVSFCPVVSKYSWKKQFAEESTKDHSSEDKLGPSSYEQFIVDNADASVVHNSKENKNVAPFFEHEKTQLLRKQAVPQGPIENELQKSHDSSPADLSEQQLRVQASLQRLNIPDWFRDYNKETRKLPFEGNDSTNSNSGGLQSVNFTRKCTQEPGRWLGLNSKTTSLSSLGSDRSPLLMIPSAHSHHDGHNTFLCRPTASHGPASGQAGLSALRWSTLHLSSTHTSPCVSQRGSFARGSYINSSFMTVASRSGLRNSYRQPYFGWRSTEKLTHWTPHERLANSLIAHRTTQYPTCASNEKRIVQSETPEIQSSIKEVTSSIVRYVNDQHNIQQSLSPNSRKYWLESSFVSSQPLDSPQTPVVDNSPPELARQQQQIDASLSSIVVTEQPSLRMNAHIGGGEPIPNKAPERLLSSASLEDVLTSLLGLPTTSFSSQNTNLYSYNIPNVSSLKTGRHFQVYVFIQHK